ncbi:MAG: hypothetical protein NZ920_00205 [Aigarchaeota archaeon]|nr:hypothetical protein [Aigarchaeota archaeon]
MGASSRGTQLKQINPLTYLKCTGCGTVSSREFREGDYVFKETEEKCPKCDSTKMIVEDIYVEEKPHQGKSR